MDAHGSLEIIRIVCSLASVSRWQEIVVPPEAFCRERTERHSLTAIHWSEFAGINLSVYALQYAGASPLRREALRNLLIPLLGQPAFKLHRSCSESARIAFLIASTVTTPSYVLPQLCTSNMIARMVEYRIAR